MQLVYNFYKNLLFFQFCNRQTISENTRIFMPRLFIDPWQNQGFC